MHVNTEGKHTGRCFLHTALWNFLTPNSKCLWELGPDLRPSQTQDISSWTTGTGFELSLKTTMSWNYLGYGHWNSGPWKAFCAVLHFKHGTRGHHDAPGWFPQLPQGYIRKLPAKMWKKRGCLLLAKTCSVATVNTEKYCVCCLAVPLEMGSNWAESWTSALKSYKTQKLSSWVLNPALTAESLF